MVGNDRNTPSSQSSPACVFLFFFFSSSESFYGIFSSVETVPVIFIKQTKGSNGINQEQSPSLRLSVKFVRRFLHLLFPLVFFFTLARGDPLVKCCKIGLCLSCVLKSLCVEIPDLLSALSFPTDSATQKGFQLLSEELSSNMQNLTVSIVAYYDIQKEQPTIWDAKIRPKCACRRVFLFSFCVFFIDSRTIIRFIVSN